MADTARAMHTTTQVQDTDATLLPPDGVDPQVFAEKLARQLAIEQTAQQIAQSRVKAGQATFDGGTFRTADGKKVVPMVAFPDVTSEDGTELRDSQGGNPVKPGFVSRWVRTHDAEGRPMESRMREFERFGYQVVKDPHTGEPIKSRFGIAMQGPPSAAAWRAVKKSPTGGLSQMEQAEAYLASADKINSATGREVIRPIVGAAHGTTVTQHSPEEL